MITCTTMRTTVLLSASLFLGGLLMLVLAEVTGVAVPTAHLALALTLGGALTLLLALGIALWPGNGARLSGCQH